MEAARTVEKKNVIEELRSDLFSRPGLPRSGELGKYEMKERGTVQNHGAFVHVCVCIKKKKRR